MKYLYKYPQAAFPYGRSSRRTSALRATEDGIRADRHRRVRCRIAISTCSSSTPKPARTTSPSRSRRTIAARTPRRCTSCPRSGSATPGRGARRRGAAALRQIGGRWDCGSGGASDPRRVLLHAKAAPSSSSPRTRATTSVFGPPNRTALRQRCLQQLRGERASGGCESGRVRDEGRSHYVLEGCRAGGSATVRLRLSDRRVRADPFGDPSRRRASAAPPEADAFYETVTPPSVGPKTAPRHAPGVGRDAVDEAVLLLRPGSVAREHGAIRCSARAPRVRNRSWFHMVNDDIISMPDKWEYPWYAAWDLAFHTMALHMVDSDFAKEQLQLMLRERLPAPERPDSGLRVELQRRESTRPRLRDALAVQVREAARPSRSAVPGALVPEAAAQFQLVGQSQGSRRAATSSTAASWASTTSASSTAARRCPPAARSSRRTARRGWRSTARTCSRWRSC